jgi:hypothetical protein
VGAFNAGKMVLVFEAKAGSENELFSSQKNHAKDLWHTHK